ncbi:hypothetical protein [uncultured Microbulbifer sp.]|uniref:hypothetical protein n=1 Tax=uncultured Microbulbifer sp. TaxID=348147 RepID=UPI002635448C|nr:hypothetical protein [uncultured Microbulbifer sp.]
MNTQPEHWHLSKSISITQIVSIILLAVALFTWGSDVEKRVGANAQAIKHESQMRSLEQKHIAEFKDDIRTRLQRIDSKLERLIERGE